MTFQAIASIPYFTLVPEDVVVNTFHFEYTGVGDPGPTQWSGVTSALAAFYEDIFPAAGAPAMAAYMRPDLFRVRIYDLDATPPRVPVSDVTTALVVKQDAVESPPPLEAALCLSYHGALISGTNPARRRGRVYIGGLGTGCLNPGTDETFPFPGTGIQTNMRLAGQNLCESAEVTQMQWVVYSRVNESSTPVVGGWTDNAIDTQRRRGNAPSARTTWTAPS